MGVDLLVVFNDLKIVEVMFNVDGKVWYECFGELMWYICDMWFS